jgi:RNA polymerase sigma-32 factor
MHLPAISGGNGFDDYMREIRSFPVLGADEEKLLAKRWHESGDVEAAHRLVTSHLRLVAKIAMGYRGYGMPVSDLIAEGNLGMMQAVKGFDPERGFRLSTYAMWWVRAAIQEYILKSWSLVKIASTAVQKKLFFNLNRARRQIRLLDEGKMTRQEESSAIADYLQVNEKDVVQMEQRMSGGDLSLNAPVSEDGEGEWIDWLEDGGEDHGTVLADRDELLHRRGLLGDALSHLGDRERDILVGRRLSEKPVTLDVLSRRYNISRERVRQIEFRAFDRVRDEMVREDDSEDR